MRRTRVFTTGSQNYVCVTIRAANLSSVYCGGKKVRRTQAPWVDDIRISASLPLNPWYTRRQNPWPVTLTRY